MAGAVPCKKMKRSKSLDTLLENVNKYSEWIEDYSGDDSGVQSHDGFLSLERKVDKLSDVCAEQTRLLAELAEQVRGRSAGDELGAVLAELLDKLAEEGENNGESGARSLLSAIEARPSLERRVGTALTDLLQSEDLKQRIVSSTTESIKELIRNLFSVEVSSLYVPVMERAHRQLLNHVTKMVATAFADLEENTACNAEALRQTSQSLQAALQRHECLLKQACDGSDRLVDAVTSTTEKVIERELKPWREEISNAMPQMSECDSGRAESPDPLPVLDSPEIPEVNENGLSPVDRMMYTAEVAMLVRTGDVNGAFSRALLAGDLEVVMSACRAVSVLAAPALKQPVLLSLLQQLATDLLLDTPLKCSYLEYALLNLNPLDPVTRVHLPLVVGELHRYLTAFLHKYPHHLQGHRIAAIITTAQKLL
ncbi:enhancer of mRNA-decapping protein 4-like [Leguminivora glycinivorella]|uniref:enhancer of mRNA-decapping protein 4-like n=1 Tax=Leguminivora glycinivorella TaxID=1035111 RepID=UPI00200FED08|nr:enhancer of mRNA-decapping protein 4-like [Leguminivora glycinivorella]